MIMRSYAPPSITIPMVSLFLTFLTPFILFILIKRLAFRDKEIESKAKSLSLVCCLTLAGFMLWVAPYV